MQAASIYADNPELRNFLEDIAEDEAWHYHVMGNAKEYLVSKPASIPAVSVDRETRNKIAGCFTDLQVCLEKNTLSIDELIRKTV